MKKTLAFVLVAAMLLCMAPAFSLFAGEVVEIDTAEEFAAIKDNLGGSYKLTADITLTEAISYKNEGALFTGTLDGNGKTITLDLKDTEGQRFAIFCSVGGCTIKNLNVKGTISSTGNSTGVVIGTVKGDGNVVTIENVTTNVSYTAPNSNNGQGGIIGAVEDKPTVKLINCVSKGDIIGECAGGLIGAVHGEATIEITGCTNEGDITSTNLYSDYRGAAGFIGKVSNNNAKVTLKDSTNKGNITADYISANAFVSHNNMNADNYKVENCKNEGTVLSGGYKLPASMDTVQDAGTWGGANFDVNFDAKTLFGNPNFHAWPDVSSYKAYINGVEATEKVTIAHIADSNRQCKVEAKFDGIPVDGFVSVTIVFADGKYATFGEVAPTKAEMDVLNDSAEILSKHEEATVDTGSVSAENPLLANGWENDPKPHGSEGCLFDADKGNKYEGWHVMGSGSVVIKFQLTEATKVGYYALGTGNDDAAFSDRQPAEWKLWASVDGNEYVLLDHVTEENLPRVNNQLVAYEAETDVEYKFFKLEILSFVSEAGKTDGQGSYVQLGQIKIYKACDHTWGDPVVKDATCTKDGSSTKTCSNCGKEEVTVIKSEGHKLVDGVCSVCGHDTNKPAPTGDSVVALVVLAVVSLLGVAVISKKRV